MSYQNTITSTPVVLVEFYATWCPHCRKMMPVVQQVTELLAGRATVSTFDIDNSQAEADKVSVRSVPTFILYKNGDEVWRQSGEIDSETLLGKVESYL